MYFKGRDKGNVRKRRKKAQKRGKPVRQESLRSQRVCFKKQRLGHSVRCRRGR